jgi:hypothetical protein
MIIFKRLYLIAFVLNLFFYSCREIADKNNLILFPVKQGLNWGFTDTNGTFIETPVYQSASEFHNGYSLVSKGNLISYVNENGTLAMPFFYTIGTDFNENLAFVSDSSDMVYCINKDFNIKFKLADLQEVHVYHEGLAAIRKNDKFGFIDTAGKTIIPTIFDAVLDFSEGVCGVAKLMGTEDSTYYSWYYINMKGERLIDKYYDEVHDFKNGLAVVQIGDKFGWVDKYGKFIFGSDFEECKDFSEAFAAFKKNGLWGLINRNGKQIIGPYYYQIGQAKEGLVQFSLGLKNSGFLDTLGKIVINPNFSNVSAFKKGYAYVVKNNKISLLNKYGKIFCIDYFDSAPGYLGSDLGFINFSMNSRLDLQKDTAEIYFETNTEILNQ